MAGYKATIAGMQPVILRGSSKPKALETLVTIESLSGEQIMDELANGLKIYQAGQPLELIAKEPGAGGKALRVNVQTGMIERRDPGQAGAAIGYREDGPAAIEQLAEADSAATWRVDAASGMVQRLPQGADAESGWEDIREATADEIKAAGGKPKKS